MTARPRPPAHPVWPHTGLDATDHVPAPLPAVRAQGARPLQPRLHLLLPLPRARTAAGGTARPAPPPAPWTGPPTASPSTSAPTASTTSGSNCTAANPCSPAPPPSGPTPDAVRLAVPEGCRVTATVQTNGTRLTERALEQPRRRHGIRVGLSLDGGRAAHNAAPGRPRGAPGLARRPRGARRARRAPGRVRRDPVHRRPGRRPARRLPLAARTRPAPPRPPPSARQLGPAAARPARRPTRPAPPRPDALRRLARHRLRRLVGRGPAAHPRPALPGDRRSAARLARRRRGRGPVAGRRRRRRDRRRHRAGRLAQVGLPGRRRDRPRRVPALLRPRSCATRASPHAKWASAPSPPSAAPARWSGCAGAATTCTGSRPAPASATPACTAPTWSG